MALYTRVGTAIALAGALMAISSAGVGQAREYVVPKPSESGGDVAWGKPVHGLQAGIRLVAGGRMWRVGQTVEFALIVRNVTDHPIGVAYYPAQDKFGWTAMTVGMRGSLAVSVLPEQPPTQLRHLSLGPAIELTIEPGKEVPVPGKHPVFDVEVPGDSAYATPIIFIQPGAKVSVQAQPLKPVAKGEEWLGKLLTGRLKFDVQASPAGGTVIDLLSGEAN